jgi:hypothetical protein
MKKIKKPLSKFKDFVSQTIIPKDMHNIDKKRKENAEAAIAKVD